MRKLRICIVGTRGIPDLQGGVEKRIENIYTRVSDFFELHIFNRGPYFKKKTRIYKGIELHYLWVPKNKYLEAPLHTFLSIIISKFYSPDILDFQAIGPSLFLPFAKILGFKKIIATHHGPDYLREKWKGFAKLVLKLGEYFSVKFADKIIVVSNYIKKYLEEKYHRYDLVVIPNGVDIPEIVEAGSTLEKYGLKPKKYVFTACRFVPEKGLIDLIEAYGRINSPTFKLVIAGDADHESDYSRKVKSLAKETPGVVLTGVLAGKPLAELYSNAGLFVLASYYEGLPLALLEALSYGLPVLVSDIPQHKEIPIPEYRFFPVGNVEKLREKILELYDKGISEEEKQRQISYLKEKHNWDEIVKQVLKNYYEVAKV
jgi:glycosyltransferase involved in cell wall biosynthesis